MKKYSAVFLLALVALLAGCQLKPIQKVPAAPSNLQAEVQTSAEGILLNWKDNSQDESGFKIFRGEVENNQTLLAEVGKNIISYEDKAVKKGVTYYYTVKALNIWGESVASNRVSASIPLPVNDVKAPSSLKAEVLAPRKVRLSWQDNSNNEHGFKLYCAISAPGNVGESIVIEANTTSYEHTVEPEKTYFYFVKAYTDEMDSESSNTVQVTTPAVTVQVTGSVVDQYGMPVSDAFLKLGQYSTCATPGGQFTFSGVRPGTYKLVVNGGSTGCYLFEKDVSIAEENYSAGVIEAYNALGVGVVIQSVTQAQTMTQKMAAQGQTEVQAQITAMKMAAQGQARVQEQITAMKSGLLDRQLSHLPMVNNVGIRRNFAPFAFLNMEKNLAFIVLRWEPVKDGWATGYLISYCPESGPLSEVWRSSAIGAEDPAFDLADPQAFLDLSNELYGYVQKPGIYTFMITALRTEGNTTYTKSLCRVTVSIGTLLDIYPESLSYDGSKLSWGVVSGASAYRVQIYDESDIRVYDSGVSLKSTSVAVPEDLILGAYYSYMVDAQAIGENGWVREITRGLSGFVR